MAKITDLKHAARETGERFFTTGQPCGRGHIGPRYASTGGCVECLTGRTDKPLSRSAQVVRRRWVFITTISTALGAEFEPHIEAYLTRCMEAFHTSKGVVFPMDNLDEKIAFTTRTGRPMAEWAPGL